MFLTRIPDALLATLFVLASVALAAIGLVLFWRAATNKTIAEHTNVATNTFGMIAVLYAVIVGTLVASAWGHFSEAQNNANREANALGELFRQAQAFDEPTHSQLQRALLAYARDVVENEWPTMKQSQPIKIASPAYENVWAQYLQVEPKTDRERAFFNESLPNLDDLGTERRARALNQQSVLSPELWVLFIIGGAIAVFFTYFFAPEHSRVHMLLIALLAGMFGFVLYLLFSLQSPYTGDLSVNPNAFKNLIELWGPRLGG